MKEKIQKMIEGGGSNQTWHRVLTAYLILIIILQIFLLFSNWPSKIEETDRLPAQTETTIRDADSLNGMTARKGNITPVPEDQLLLLVIVVGSLGASLHAATSLSEFIGNKSFDKHWVIWYLLRPFVGGVLVILFYFVMRAGLITNFNESSNFYVVIAVSGLVGLFSKQAMYKLSDIFDVIFMSDKEKKLKGKITEKNPVPDIDKITPEQIDPAAEDKTIKISGCDFIKESKVKINGKEVPTEFVNHKELTAAYDKIEFKDKSEISVTVTNPEPNGGESKEFKLTVKQTN